MACVRPPSSICIIKETAHSGTLNRSSACRIAQCGTELKADARSRYATWEALPCWVRVFSSVVSNRSAVSVPSLREKPFWSLCINSWIYTVSWMASFKWRVRSLRGISSKQMGRPFCIDAPFVGSFVSGNRRASCHAFGTWPTWRQRFTILRRNSFTLGGASDTYLYDMPDFPGAVS